MLVIKIGGPAYRIGMGGGAASSVPSGGSSRAELDFNAVQVCYLLLHHLASLLCRFCYRLLHYLTLVLYRLCEVLCSPCGFSAVQVSCLVAKLSAYVWIVRCFERGLSSMGGTVAVPCGVQPHVLPGSGKLVLVPREPVAMQQHFA